jgi:hypothetical protein
VHSQFWLGDLRNATTWETQARWEDNIKMGLQDVGRGGMDRIELAQDTDRLRAHMNAIMNLQIPENVEDFLTSCDTC